MSDEIDWHAEWQERLKRDPRAPMPPALLMDARHDTVHQDRGIGRPVRTVKVPK